MPLPDALYNLYTMFGAPQYNSEAQLQNELTSMQKEQSSAMSGLPPAPDDPLLAKRDALLAKEQGPRYSSYVPPSNPPRAGAPQPGNIMQNSATMRGPGHAIMAPQHSVFKDLFKTIILAEMKGNK